MWPTPCISSSDSLHDWTNSCKAILTVGEDSRLMVRVGISDAVEMSTRGELDIVPGVEGEPEVDGDDMLLQ